MSSNVKGSLLQEVLDELKGMREDLKVKVTNPWFDMWTVSPYMTGVPSVKSGRMMMWEEQERAKKEQRELLAAEAARLSKKVEEMQAEKRAKMERDVISSAIMHDMVATIGKDTTWLTDKDGKVVFAGGLETAKACLNLWAVKKKPIKITEKWTNLGNNEFHVKYDAKHDDNVHVMEAEEKREEAERKAKEEREKIELQWDRLYIRAVNLGFRLCKQKDGCFRIFECGGKQDWLQEFANTHHGTLTCCGFLDMMEAKRKEPKLAPTELEKHVAERARKNNLALFTERDGSFSISNDLGKLATNISLKECVTFLNGIEYGFGAGWVKATMPKPDDISTPKNPQPPTEFEKLQIRAEGLGLDLQKGGAGFLVRQVMKVEVIEPGKNRKWFLLVFQTNVENAVKNFLDGYEAGRGK